MECLMTELIWNIHKRHSFVVVVAVSDQFAQLICLSARWNLHWVPFYWLSSGDYNAFKMWGSQMQMKGVHFGLANSIDPWIAHTFVSACTICLNGSMAKWAWVVHSWVVRASNVGLKTFAPHSSKLGNQSDMETVLRVSGMADKLQCLDLEDHGKRATHRMSKSRWSIRRQRRRRRVRLHVWPVLGYLRTLRKSMARSIAESTRMDPRLPGSKLGVFLAKLHFHSCQRARRIHSCQGSNQELENSAVLPLLHCNAA